jgi:hypothetical protein
MRASLLTVLLLGAAQLAGTRLAKAERPSAHGFSEGEQPRPPHPEPRVVVNVLSVHGPHKPDRVQHSARFGWKRIVRCYKASGAKEHALVTLELVVSGEGNVARARGIVVEPKDRELASCLEGALPGLAMPKAPADSTADVEIVLSPGDRPPKNQSQSIQP